MLLNSAKNVRRQVIYTKLAEGFTGPTIRKAFDLLSRTRLIYRIQSSSAAGIPLGTTVSARRFRALFADIWLMHNLCGVRKGEDFYKKELLSIYNGALAQQFTI
ncbi:MAG: hypothetical protein J7K04_11760 [Spirochaetales bacterium]|nr:hypothetical protein [Spirochaetales bacterium]